jgi:hypothetical protein
VTVYLLCFDVPEWLQQRDPHPWRPRLHYIGYATHLRRRLEAHAAGRGAKLTRAARELGVPWELTRTWPEGTRTLERYLKQRLAGVRFCPKCSPGTTTALSIDTTYIDRYVQEPRHVQFYRPKVRRPYRFRFEPNHQEVTA